MRCTYSSAPVAVGGQRGFGRAIQGSALAPTTSFSNSFGLGPNKENEEYYPSSKNIGNSYSDRISGSNAADLAGVASGASGGHRDRPSAHYPYAYNASSLQNHPKIYPQSHPYDYGNSGGRRPNSGASNYAHNQYNHNSYAPYPLPPSAYYPYAVDPKYLVPFNRRNYTYQRQHDRLRFEEYFYPSSSSSTTTLAPTPPSTDPIIPPSVSATPTSRPSSAIGGQEPPSLQPPSSVSSASFLGFHASISSQQPGGRVNTGAFNNTMHPTSAIPIRNRSSANSPTEDDLYASAALMEPQDVSLI